jgi:hypothetical protein
MITAACKALAQSLLYSLRVRQNAQTSNRNFNLPFRRFTMNTLIIKDLAVTAELDGAAMASVHGGSGMSGLCKGMPSYYPSFDVNKNDFKFDATQLLNQSQNTVVNNGNNVAFASGITSTVTPH